MVSEWVVVDEGETATLPGQISFDFENFELCDGD